mmetsp:Transcript_6091/g.16772  ORF Transcript_6091/g.16772 Transcript_6091/m.16772 type:complete len:219 (-) Transcript_6091:3060-3716(-)
MQIRGREAPVTLDAHQTDADLNDRGADEAAAGNGIHSGELCAQGRQQSCKCDLAPGAWESAQDSRHPPKARDYILWVVQHQLIVLFCSHAPGVPDHHEDVCQIRSAHCNVEVPLQRIVQGGVSATNVCSTAVITVYHDGLHLPVKLVGWDANLIAQAKDLLVRIDWQHTEMTTGGVAHAAASRDVDGDAAGAPLRCGLCEQLLRADDPGLHVALLDCR